MQICIRFSQIFFLPTFYMSDVSFLNFCRIFKLIWLSDPSQIQKLENFKSIEPIYIVNVTLNVRLNDDHQRLKDQSLDPFML